MNFAKSRKARGRATTSAIRARADRSRVSRLPDCRTTKRITRARISVPMALARTQKDSAWVRRMAGRESRMKPVEGVRRASETRAATLGPRSRKRFSAQAQASRPAILSTRCSVRTRASWRSSAPLTSSPAKRKRALIPRVANRVTVGSSWKRLRPGPQIAPKTKHEIAEGIRKRCRIFGTMSRPKRSMR